MSIYVYLSSEARMHKNFTSQPYPDKSGDRMAICGIQVFDKDGRLYMMMGDYPTIPDEIKDLVQEISCHETIPQMGSRESGIYRYGSAECELIPGDNGNAKTSKPVYFLKVTAKSVDDIRTILHKVKTGTIRPAESYDGLQGGKSYVQLESELLSTQQLLAEWLEANQKLRQDLIEKEQILENVRRMLGVANEKLSTVRRFVRDIGNGWIPVLRSRVAFELKAILNESE